MLFSEQKGRMWEVMTQDVKTTNKERRRRKCAVGRRQLEGEGFLQISLRQGSDKVACFTYETLMKVL